jgi:ornithine cyclodeaminase/alanine dehydrogenase-like protein (mu-crystallin family)
VGLIEWMPVMRVGREVMVKMVGYHPRNPMEQRLPTIISTVSSYDTCSGHLTGIADGTFLTALRTGAASAVASQLLAEENSQVVGILGCGLQAVTQLHALTRIFPIQKVYACDINPEVTLSYVKRTAFTGVPVIPVEMESVNDLLVNADILCTCTSVGVGEGPVFADTTLKEWVHVNAVGSDFHGKFELPLALLRRSLVCPDFLDQAVMEGECQQLELEEIGPTITEVAKNSGRYAGEKKRSTVFDSTGWALEDQAALDLLLDYAHSLSIGSQIEIENVSEDPRDPYAFVKAFQDGGTVVER